jgi:acyl-CoA synthetase (AMP-forming)/AMP-acid ligase II
MAKDSTGVAVSDGKAVVVGLPDEKWGKIVTAFVKRKGPANPDVRQNCSSSCSPTSMRFR